MIKPLVIAKEKGLEPLADLLWAQDPATDSNAAALAYVGHEYVPDDIKKLAAKTAPAVQMHLNMAEKIQKGLKKQS